MNQNSNPKRSHSISQALEGQNVYLNTDKNKNKKENLAKTNSVFKSSAMVDYNVNIIKYKLEECV